MRILVKIRFLMLVLIAGISPFVISPVQGAVTSYAFEGVLEDSFQFSAPIPQWTFAAGQRFRGSFTYDPSLIQFTDDIINDDTGRLTRHASPIVSFQFSIEMSDGQYSVNYPTFNGNGFPISSAVFSNRINSNGAELRLLNYPIGFRGNPNEVPFPTSAFVGPYTPHSAFLFFQSPDRTPILDSGDPDVNFEALFNNLGPASIASFTVRFSDSFAWEIGRERVDGFISGRVQRLVAIQTAVPEPAAWTMMIVGFGFVGGALRRQKLAMRGRKRLAQ